jgi:anti-sigma factor RsiW
MSEHLDASFLNALVSGELSELERAEARKHLAECSSCTAVALSSAMLKLATAKAGARYVPSPEFAERIARQSRGMHAVEARSSRGPMVAWVTAAVLAIAALASLTMMQRTQKNEVAAVSRAAAANEILDQHVAALSPDRPLGVISTDRHTVKPWFQGRVPFSFSLPEALPEGTSLEGADMTYLHGKPTAQLIYRIGKHRASLFVTLQEGVANPVSASERAGFHLRSFSAGPLQVQAVSDVNPVELDALVKVFKDAQRVDRASLVSEVCYSTSCSA